MFKLNKKLKESVNIFSKLDPKKAEIILDRIFSAPFSTSSQKFSEKEEKKLLNLLEISESDFHTMINSFSFIFMHAVAEKNFKQILQTFQEHDMKEDLLEVFYIILQFQGST